MAVISGGRRRRRRVWPLAVLIAVLAAAAAAALAAGGRHDPAPRAAAPTPAPTEQPRLLEGTGTAPAPLAVRLDDPHDLISVPYRKPPRSGLLFDLDTGRVLWRRDPGRVLPIASLTKMMTALVVADRVPRGGRVRITREALRYQGSGVGLLPRGKLIDVETML
jgi:D-alanyl-D-alanine carboxypeptidase